MRRPGTLVEVAIFAAGALLVPAEARAHNPGAALLSLLVIICGASLVAYLPKRLLLRRWDPPGHARRWWVLPSLAAAEVASATIAAALLLTGTGLEAPAAALLVAAALLGALHWAVPAPSARRPVRVLLLAAVWPVAVAVLFALQLPLYVLLGG